ncbi:MAG TPA: hypothetical protein VFV81_04935, partial [Verrucomicrobiae bacterium]|nr:hypothetical protein [Verrucomicrobiae bacterium]
MNPNPPPVPPVIPPVPAPAGDDASDHLPVSNVIAAIEALLRQPRRVIFQLRQPGAGRLIAA